MHETQKTRLIMLAIAGLLFGVGVYGMYWYQNQKSAQETELESLTAHVNAPLKKKAPSLASALINSGKTAAGGTTPPGSGTPTASAPVATPGQPTNNPSAAPIKLPPVASKPAVNASATAPVTAPNSAPLAALPTGKLPPVAGKPSTAIAPATAPNSALALSKLPPVAAKAPPALIPHTLGSTPPKPGVPEPAPVAAAPPVAPASATVTGLNVPATTLDQAKLAAKTGSGRQDPTLPLTALLPFPRPKSGEATVGFVPPPPPSLSQIDDTGKAKNDTTPAAKAAKGIGAVGKIKEKLVPPPPPTEATASGNNSLGGLAIDEIPLPPSRPIIGDQMKVVAVLDNKAVVSFPSSLRLKNKWPKFLTLSSGQQFESITLVSIGKDGVTIEEDGERSLKPIANVK